ncbi:MAG: DUF928 domain-containing protein [Cyanobacteria bacterium P01_F01_bin.150]
MNPLFSISLQLLSSKAIKRRSRQWGFASITCTAICWGLFQTATWGLFPDFRGTGRPGNHGSGASRTGCPVEENAPLFTLLVPEEAQYGGYTTEANPNVWAYIPYFLGEDSSITFSLEDNSGAIIYTTFHDLEHEPGILKLDLPPSVSLEIGQSYEWYLMIHCDDPERKDVADWASGWIERVADPVTEDIDELPLVEQSNVYANQLIWYDALNILAEGRLESPNDLQLIEAWTNLLSLPSVKLDEFSTQAIRDCCILSDSPEEI